MEIKVLRDVTGKYIKAYILLNGHSISLGKEILNEGDLITYEGHVYRLKYICSTYNEPVGYHEYYYELDYVDIDVPINLDRYVNNYYI